MSERDQRDMKAKNAGRFILRTIAVLLVTVLILAAGVVAVVAITLRGPSVAASELLTRSLKETSAMGWLPEYFLSAERVAEIMSYKEAAESSSSSGDTTDASLVTISATREETDDPSSPTEEAPGADIEFEEITGAAYRGIMMIVKDPKRLFVGTPDSYGGRGLTLEKMVEKYDAIGGVNGGGFYDPNGTGGGGIPDGIVVVDGEMKYGSASTTSVVIGFDFDGVLHVGKMTGQEAMERNMRWACSFGPALIINGEAQSDKEITSSGVNPRTAIGQRSDGAVLLLVVDGRQITSLGATYEDLISIMLDHGAVNAANLDGGSSSQMIYRDETLNVNASVIGKRPLPTAFLVTKLDNGTAEGGDDNG